LKTGRIFHARGAGVAATVLNSRQAVEMSVFVVRAFVQLREMLSAHRELAARLDALERKAGSHDQAIAGLIDAIRQLMIFSGNVGMDGITSLYEEQLAGLNESDFAKYLNIIWTPVQTQVFWA
jgi:hypothetical protein